METAFPNAKSFHIMRIDDVYGECIPHATLGCKLTEKFLSLCHQYIPHNYTVCHTLFVQQKLRIQLKPSLTRHRRCHTYGEFEAQLICRPLPKCSGIPTFTIYLVNVLFPLKAQDCRYFALCRILWWQSTRC